ncbi:MAG: sulfatase-like hydrolase/transferase [Verrucomicrobiota bacterium]
MSQGLKLNHFYAGNSVCSPTRGTCLTGRFHDRYGIFTANNGHLVRQEITLPEILKEKGYTTGHFGKWHLGTLSKTITSKGSKRKPAENYLPPADQGYDTSFVTESAINTWNPGSGNRAKNNPFYENGIALDPQSPSLLGGAARVVVDRALPFIEQAIDDETPFLAVVWFHAPHEDIEAGPRYLDMYKGHGEAAHYYGCITELDDQVGRIHKLLSDKGVLEDTLIFFCSDNGPEGKEAKGRRMGSADGLRGRKRALYDGGVRVPAFAVWPKRIQPNSESDSILSTLDYFPTIQNLIGYQMPDDRPIDGEDILPILTGTASNRSKSIPFRFSGGTSSLISGGYKFLLPSRELYNLNLDRVEKHNLVSQQPERAAAMERELKELFTSIKQSHSGADYNDPTFTPVDDWRPLKTKNSDKK